METSSTLIGLIIIVLFMGPIVYLILKSSAAEKKLKKSLQNLSSQNGISIDAVEIIGNTLIGIDKSIHKLVFSYKSKLEGTFKAVDLNTVRECTVTTFKERKQHVNRVALQLKSATSTDEIVFYEENDDSSSATDAEVCLNRANYWKKMIKQQI